MIGVAVTIKNAEAIRHWGRTMPTEFGRRAALLVGSYVLRIEREAKQATPVKTNFLRSSLHTQVEERGNTIIGKVGTNVKYGTYVEYGTGLYGPKHRKYEIKPKGKKALAFRMQAASALPSGRALYRTAAGKLTPTKSKGALTVVRKVIHPGVHPRPFLHPPFDRLLPYFLSDLKLLGNLNFPGA
jgi:hypothetical protein